MSRNKIRLSLQCRSTKEEYRYSKFRNVPNKTKKNPRMREVERLTSTIDRIILTLFESDSEVDPEQQNPMRIKIKKMQQAERDLYHTERCVKIADIEPVLEQHSKANDRLAQALKKLKQKEIQTDKENDDLRRAVKDLVSEKNNELEEIRSKQSKNQKKIDSHLKKATEKKETQNKDGKTLSPQLYFVVGILRRKMTRTKTVTFNNTRKTIFEITTSSQDIMVATKPPPKKKCLSEKTC
uniref:Uncharacterized protein n=1 Tax=Strigamia maritima TaxID=126957 RepID=T1IY03_STRMM